MSKDIEILNIVVDKDVLEEAIIESFICIVGITLAIIIALGCNDAGCTNYHSPELVYIVNHT